MSTEIQANLDDSPVVAYLGPQGTFSHAAAMAFFEGRGGSNPFTFDSCASIEDVFASVESARSRFGVVPIENSTEGAVNNTQDCLLLTPVRIIGEIVIPIVHNFLVAPGVTRESLHTVASHKQSLAQCRRWLARNEPALDKRECASNAQAAEAAMAEPGVAAIAGEFAAQTYGLHILADSIQDHSHNSTRFLILAQPDVELPAVSPSVIPTGSAPTAVQSKTSLLVATDNKPGALFRLLEPFNALQIDLSKIEARPSKLRAWEYVFFIDFISESEEPEVIEALLVKLAPSTTSLRVLGTYPLAPPIPTTEGASGE